MMRMQAVDLTLAVNYVPACGCLLKVVGLMFFLAAIPSGEEVQSGYMLLAAGLYVDRLVVRNLIFDANAVLLAVFFANVHAVIRANTATAQPHVMLVWGWHLAWAGVCVLLLADPPQLRHILEKRDPKLPPVLLMLLTVVVSSHFQCDLEPSPIRACRALAFTLLAFAWIYMVGIHSHQGIEYLKETSCQFVARLAPLLYSPTWLAAVFGPAVVWALAMQHVRRASSSSSSPSGPHQYQYATLPVSSLESSGSGGQAVMIIAEPPAVACSLEEGLLQSGTTTTTTMIQSNHESELEVLFRQAKQAKQQRPVALS